MNNSDTTNVYYLGFPKNGEDRLKELFRLSHEYHLETGARFLIADFDHNEEEFKRLFSQICPAPFSREIFCTGIGLMELKWDVVLEKLNKLVTKGNWQLLSVNLPEDIEKTYKSDLISLCKKLTGKTEMICFIIGNDI